MPQREDETRLVGHPIDDLPDYGQQIGVFTGRGRGRLFVQRQRLRPAPAQVVRRLARRDRHQVRPVAARVTKARQGAVTGEKDLLADVLGVGFLAHGRPHDAKDRGGVAPHQFREQLGLAAHDGLDQGAVGLPHRPYSRAAPEILAPNPGSLRQRCRTRRAQVTAT